MQVNLIPLTPDSKDWALFSSINQEAFPPSEYMPAEEMLRFAENTGAEILGIYDGQCLVGFFLFLKNETCGYLFFFAIHQAQREKGYGALALKALAELCGDLQIILDFEELDENAENAEQRIRRRGFYLRNGFHETGRYTLLRSNRFEVVCNHGALRVASFRELIQVLHSQCPDFPDLLL